MQYLIKMIVFIGGSTKMKKSTDDENVRTSLEKIKLREKKENMENHKIKYSDRSITLQFNSAGGPILAINIHPFYEQNKTMKKYYYINNTTTIVSIIQNKMIKFW